MNSLKDLTLEAADGHLVPARFLSNRASNLVILSHGITTNKDEDGTYTRFAENYLAPDFDSIRFDFRGHGDSKMPTHEVTIAGEILDLMAVIRWARSQGYRRLFHLATSFGASVTLLVASRFSIRDMSGVVFWNPVVSYENTFINATVEWARDFFDQQDVTELAYRRGTPIPETNFLIGPRMTMELLNLKPDQTRWPSDVRLLVIHGDQDTSVPHSDAKKYCDHNRNVADFRSLPGVDHGFDERLDEAFLITVEWLKGSC